MIRSRRQFGRCILAALPAYGALARGPATFEGVRIGVCTYSFRDVPRRNGDAVEPTLQALKECDAHICELFSPQLEPENRWLAQLMQEVTKPRPDGSRLTQDQIYAKYRAAMKTPEAAKYREQVRQWRLNTPMDYFHKVRAQFDAAGVDIYAYTLNFDNEFMDEELDKCFEQANALKVKTIASSTQISMLPRLKPMAEKHKIYVAVHGHSDTKHPDEFSSPASFQQALDLSDWFRVNLDIGHFTAAGFDPVAYLNEHHDRITHIHVKDRKKNDGPNEPFGQGNTPIVAVLRLLKQKHYPIPALVEYEYQGNGTPVQEVNNCLAYMKQALQGA
ncbi:MAG: TIM barrel protein [Acidobacteriaceae bacterium]|nr:TIM barrel protein [Acidobacteriaceae bacterium]